MGARGVPEARHGVEGQGICGDEAARHLGLGIRRSKDADLLKILPEGIVRELKGVVTMVVHKHVSTTTPMDIDKRIMTITRDCGQEGHTGHDCWQKRVGKGKGSTNGENKETTYRREWSKCTGNGINNVDFQSSFQNPGALRLCSQRAPARSVCDPSAPGRGQLSARRG